MLGANTTVGVFCALCVAGCAAGRQGATESTVPAVRPAEAAPGAKKVAIEWLREEGATADAPEVKPEVLIGALPEVARDMLDSAVPGVEFWARLDGERFLTQIRWGAVESTVLVVDAKGAVVGKLDIDRRVPNVGVVDIVGDDRKEVVVESVDGNALSVYPKAWRFYRVGDDGGLELLATVAESHGYGPKCIAYFFRNEVTTPEKGLIRVENVYFDEQGPEPPATSPKAPGESYELEWNEKEQQLERVELPPRKTDPSKGGCDSPEGEMRTKDDPLGL